MKLGKKTIGLLVIVGICAMFFGGLKATAEKDTENTYYKYYTSIRVEEGDTLWELAGRYGNETCQSTQEYIREIKRMNHLTEDTIHAGKYLTVVYYSQELK